MTRGRPRGSKNKTTRLLRETIAQLDREGRIDLASLITDLYADAKSDNPILRMAARKELLDRAHGKAPVAIDVTQTAELGESWQELIARVITGPQGRRNREELADWREQRRLAASTKTDSP